MSVCLIATPLLSAVLAAPPESKTGVRIVTPQAYQPKVIARDKAFIVHAIPRSTDRGWVAGSLLAWRDQTITHTALPKGTMRVLARSGVFRTFSPPMGINRIAFTKTELIGVAVKHRRIAVLMRVSHAGAIVTGWKPAAPRFGKPHYRLTLFNAADGKELSSLWLTPAKLPKVAVKRTIGAGSLKLKSDRILIGIRTILIDAKGQMRLSQDGEK